MKGIVAIIFSLDPSSVSYSDQKIFATPLQPTNQDRRRGQCRIHRRQPESRQASGLENQFSASRHEMSWKKCMIFQNILIYPRVTKIGPLERCRLRAQIPHISAILHTNYPGNMNTVLITGFVLAVELDYLPICMPASFGERISRMSQMVRSNRHSALSKQKPGLIYFDT